MPIVHILNRVFCIRELELSGSLEARRGHLFSYLCLREVTARWQHAIKTVGQCTTLVNCFVS